MVKDTDPSPAALWSRAAAGITKPDDTKPNDDKQEPVVQEPKSDDGRKRLHPPRELQDKVHAESDARLLQQMQARLQREQQQRALARMQRQMQYQQMQQAQQTAPPMIPQPNPVAIRQALQARQQAPPHLPPRPPKRSGFERMAGMMTTGSGICKSWQQSKRQRRKGGIRP